MESLTDRARAAGVSLVRIAYCDNANLIRAKTVPLDGLEDVLRWGVGFSVAQQALPMIGDTVLAASGLTAAGEAWLVPDPATFTPLPYSAGCATMLGDFVTVSFDGSGRIWMAGEYANIHTDPTVAPWFGRNWGTWMGAIETGN